MNIRPARPWIARSAIALLALVATGCDRTPFGPTATDEPPMVEPSFVSDYATCDTVQVFVAWNAPTPCDVSPPQVLTLWAPYPEDLPFWRADCDDFGGVFVADASVDRIYCAHIDY